jgi:hypothetical protein
VDRTGSGSCPVADFGNNDVESFNYATIVFVCLLNDTENYDARCVLFI